MAETKRLKGKIGEEFEDIDTIDTDFQDVSDLQGDIDSELSDVTSEFGKDENEVNFKIKLHRVLEKKGEREWLFDIVPSELPVMDRIRDEYGGGKYEASLYKNGRLFRKFHWSIASPRTNYIPPNKNNTLDMASVMNAMLAQQKEQFNQFKELMLQVARPAQTSTFNPMDMMTGLMAAMVQMKAFLSPPSNNSGDGAEKYISALTKGIELAKDLGGGGDKETNLLDVIRDLVKSPVFEKVIESSSSVVASVPQIPVNQPIKIPQSENINQPGNVNDMNFIEKKFIEPQLNNLVKLAKSGKNPELYAEVLLDNLPPQINEEIINKYLTNENIIEDLSKINPEVKNHSEWFLAFKDAIKELISSENQEPLTEDENKDNDE